MPLASTAAINRKQGNVAAISQATVMLLVSLGGYLAPLQPAPSVLLPSSLKLQAWGRCSMNS